MKKIAIFASGSGTNAENIIRYFQTSKEIEVALVLTNNPVAGVIERARRLHVPTLVFSKKNLVTPGGIVRILRNVEVDWIVLAGFLWLVPENLIQAYAGRIINVHPALLPKFGGKGMWGHHVHEAVVQSGETESGITVHYVNEHYDEGEIIFQARCQVEAHDTADTLAAKIHGLEYRYFPEVIEKTVLQA